MSAPDVLTCTLEDLVQRARSLAVPGERRLLGLTGAPGAGKSTVAAALALGLGPQSAQVVAMDGFHLANSVLADLGQRDRKGAPDTFDDAGYVALLSRLRADDPHEIVYAPQFRREVDEPVGSAVPIPADLPLVITEGNYLLLDTGAWARVRSLLDVVWYIELEETERLDRLVRRHERFGKSAEQAESWARGSDQRNAEVITATRGRADLVVRLR